MTRWFRYFVYAGIFLAALGLSAYLTTGIIVRGKPEVVVPDLTGSDTVSALNQLAGLGLSLKIQGFDHSGKIAKDRIIDQDPLPGMKVKSGRDIRVVLSKGPRARIVPELRGLSLEQAQSILLQNEIELGQISYAYSAEGQEADRVLAQTPAPSTEVGKEGRVDLLISLGPRPQALILPDFTGQNVNQVLLKLEQAGLKAGPVRYDFRPNWPLGAVLLQDPPPGSRIVPGTEVTLTVNREGGETHSGIGRLDRGFDPGLLGRKARFLAPTGDAGLDVRQARQERGGRMRVQASGSAWRPGRDSVNGLRTSLVLKQTLEGNS
jgi:serine/threonine-protein kinase